MILFYLFSFSIISSGIYLYFTQIKFDNIIWWSIPIVFVIAFLVAFILFVFLITFLALIHNKNDKLHNPKKIYNHFIYYVAQFLKSFFRIKVILEGKELLPKDGKYMWVCNHQSNFDPIISLWAFKESKLTYVMKKNILKLPLIGRFLLGAGFLPIDRENDRKSVEAIIHATNRVANGGTIGIFPEGTRSKTKEMKTFRSGAFKIAQRAKAPIVVVALDGMYKVKDRFPFKKTIIIMKVCEVIPVDYIEAHSTNEISDRVKNSIQVTLDMLRLKHSFLR